MAEEKCVLDCSNSCYFFFFCSDLYGLCVFGGVCFLLYHFLMQAAVSVKALEKQLQQKKESDPIMTGILEEVRDSIINTCVPCTTFNW